MKATRRAGLSAVLLLATAAGVSADDRLIEAAREQDRRAALALIGAGADVNTAGADGATALHWAVQWDDLDLAAALIGAKAAPDPSNDYGVTPLMLAALNGSARMVDLLLEAGANAGAAQPSGETVLMTAARTGNLAVVRALLRAGADPAATEAARGQTALMWAAAERHLDAARALVEGGADFRARSNDGFTALLFASRMGDRDLVEYFLGLGGDVNEGSADGTTPLMAATVRGHVDLAEWLLDHGADPNKADIGYAALHWASGTFDTMSTREYTPEEGEWSALAGIPVRDVKLRFIKSLLAHGAEVNARVTGRMPRFGYSLGGGSIIGGGSYVGATPFFLASTVGDMGVMRLLLAHGADPLLATADRTTPLLATAGISIVEAETSTTEDRLLEALRLTMALGNDIRAANNAGTTALHATAYVGFNAIAQFLVDAGVELNARNAKEETPYKIASGIPMSGMFYSQPKTAALLKSLGGVE